MVSELAVSAVDRGFESRSGKTKDYKIGICCFSIKHATLGIKSKDWFAQNKDNIRVEFLLDYFVFYMFSYTENTTDS